VQLKGKKRKEGRTSTVDLEDCSKGLIFEMGQGQSVALRGAHRKYISASNSGRVRADQFECNEDASFEIHFVDPTTVAFRSFHGKWLCVEPSGYIVCDREERRHWEAFTLTPALQGKFGFKTHHNKFLSVQPDGYFSADKTFVGDWEMFDVEMIDMEEGNVSIVGAHGHYITADPEGRVYATRDKCGKSETFEKVVVSPTQVAFKSANGKWLSADPDGRIGTQEKRGKSEIFYIHPAPNNKYSIRSSHGKFLCAEPEGKISANRDLPLDWEAFAIKSL